MNAARRRETGTLVLMASRREDAMRRAGNGGKVGDGERKRARSFMQIATTTADPRTGLFLAQRPEDTSMDQRTLIAVVDDDESVRESLPDLLCQLGYDTR